MLAAVGHKAIARAFRTKQFRRRRIVAAGKFELRTEHMQVLDLRHDENELPQVRAVDPVLVAQVQHPGKQIALVADAFEFDRIAETGITEDDFGFRHENHLNLPAELLMLLQPEAVRCRRL